MPASFGRSSFTFGPVRSPIQATASRNVSCSTNQIVSPPWVRSTLAVAMTLCGATSNSTGAVSTLAPRRHRRTVRA